MFSALRRSLIQLNEIHYQQNNIASQQQKERIELIDSKILMGKLLAELNELKFRNEGFLSINNYEFRVFSQFGDDGIIQFLIKRVQPEKKIFIEFGVENYDESNTKFLLVNNNWKGLIFDGDKSNMGYVKNQEYFWRHALTAEAQFITKENINDLITSNGFQGRIGILHVDLDGNDYWIWETINCVSPDILILEYNSVYGKEHAWTVPYKADFNRTAAHFSNLYWGASLKALNILSANKGYSFVGCNDAGNNAYYIKSEIIGQKNLEYLVANTHEGFRDSNFRESRDASYKLTYLSGMDRLKAIEGCEVFDVLKNQNVTIG